MKINRPCGRSFFKSALSVLISLSLAFCAPLAAYGDEGEASLARERAYPSALDPSGRGSNALGELELRASASGSSYAFELEELPSEGVPAYAAVVPATFQQLGCRAVLSEGAWGGLTAEYEDCWGDRQSIPMESGVLTALPYVCELGSMRESLVTICENGVAVATILVKRQPVLVGLDACDSSGAPLGVSPAIAYPNAAEPVVLTHAMEVMAGEAVTFKPKFSPSACDVTVNGMALAGGAATVEPEWDADGRADVRIEVACGLASTAYTVCLTRFDVPFEGSGTWEDPYIVSSADDLVALSGMVNSGKSFAGKRIAMACDIELPRDWVPMGCTIDGTDNIQSGANLYPFSGSFDGGGHTLTVPAGGLPLIGYPREAAVRNLGIYGERIEGYGLVNNFEGVGLQGTAVTIENVTLKSGTSTLKAGLLGGNLANNGFGANSYQYVAYVRDCVAEEGVVVGYDGAQDCIGSFGGRFQGTIENCVSYAEVRGRDYVGGIMGALDNAMTVPIVRNCAFHGSVEGRDYVGGVLGAGYNYNPTAPQGMRPVLRGNVVDGTVEGVMGVGGIFGGCSDVLQAFPGSSEITKNQFTGRVSGEERVGAIIGYLASLNKQDRISGNLYSHDCGASVGIGGVKYVDTSKAEHETVLGEFYVNTAKELPNVTAGTIEYPAAGFVRRNYNRTDDPLGADADKLCKVMTYYLAEVAAEAPDDLRVGDEICVSVSVKGNDGLSAMRARLDYDPGRLELAGMERGAGLSEGAEFSALGTDGSFSFSGNEDDASRGIVVATAVFKVLSPGEVSVGISEEGADAPMAASAGDVPDQKVTTGAPVILVARTGGPADEPGLGAVHVVVENTTCPAPAAAWTGTLVDAEVELAPGSTMMSCIRQAIEESGHIQVGAERGYISSIDGLAEHDGDDYDTTGLGYSGWMGTLNDWFTNEGFSAYSVENGRLAAGDEIRVMYSCVGGGLDLGNVYGGSDRSLKGVTFSAGSLRQEFDGASLSYVLDVPEGTDSVLVAPTAANKSFQARIFVDGVQFRRSAAVPVSDGAVVTVKCGYESLDEEDDSENVLSYSFKVVVSPKGATLGDVNANGRVNIVDAQIVYDLGCGVYGAGFVNYPLPEGWTASTLAWAADVNGDDAVDAADAFAIQRFVHYGAWS